MNIGIAGNGKIIDLAGEAIVSQPDFHCTAIAVSYTHLDVYKRQW